MSLHRVTPSNMMGSDGHSRSSSTKRSSRTTRATASSSTPTASSQYHHIDSSLSADEFKSSHAILAESRARPRKEVARETTARRQQPQQQQRRSSAALALPGAARLQQSHEQQQYQQPPHDQSFTRDYYSHQHQQQPQHFRSPQYHHQQISHNDSSLESQMLHIDQELNEMMRQTNMNDSTYQYPQPYVRPSSSAAAPSTAQLQLASFMQHPSPSPSPPNSINNLNHMNIPNPITSINSSLPPSPLVSRNNPFISLVDEIDAVLAKANANGRINGSMHNHIATQAQVLVPVGQMQQQPHQPQQQMRPNSAAAPSSSVIEQSTSAVHPAAPQPYAQAHAPLQSQPQSQLPQLQPQPSSSDSSSYQLRDATLKTTHQLGMLRITNILDRTQRRMEYHVLMKLRSAVQSHHHLLQLRQFKLSSLLLTHQSTLSSSITLQRYFNRWWQSTMNERIVEALSGWKRETMEKERRNRRYSALAKVLQSDQHRARLQSMQQLYRAFHQWHVASLPNRTVASRVTFKQVDSPSKHTTITPSIKSIDHTASSPFFEEHISPASSIATSTPPAVDLIHLLPLPISTPPLDDIDAQLLAFEATRTQLELETRALAEKLKESGKRKEERTRGRSDGTMQPLQIHQLSIESIMLLQQHQPQSQQPQQIHSPSAISLSQYAPVVLTPIKPQHHTQPASSDDLFVSDSLELTPKHDASAVFLMNYQDEFDEPLISFQSPKATSSATSYLSLAAAGSLPPRPISPTRTSIILSVFDECAPQANSSSSSPASSTSFSSTSLGAAIRKVGLRISDLRMAKMTDGAVVEIWQTLYGNIILQVDKIKFLHLVEMILDQR